MAAQVDMQNANLCARVMKSITCYIRWTCQQASALMASRLLCCLSTGMTHASRDWIELVERFVATNASILFSGEKGCVHWDDNNACSECERQYPDIEEGRGGGGWARLNASNCRSTDGQFLPKN